MKTHLHKFLTKMAEHHIAKSRHHAAKAEHHEKLGQHYGSLGEMHKAKNDAEDPATVYASISKAHAETAEEHKGMAEEHNGMAAACIKLAKTLAEIATGQWPARKAAGSSSGDELEPTAVSAVVPDNPNATKVFAIPRPGSPPLPEKANVPREFRKFISVDDDEE